MFYVYSQTKEAEKILRGDQLLPIEAVADRFKLSVETVRRWTKTGRIKGMRFPGVWRYRLEDIVQFEQDCYQ